MLSRFILLSTVLISAGLLATASTSAQSTSGTPQTWRKPGSVVEASAAEPVTPPSRTTAKAKSESSGSTHVTRGTGVLPNDRGQVWREYDISPYTMRVTTGDRPQQAIIDWILRETGYEAWHGDTVTVLGGTRRKLRVYHTPEIQAIVSQIVDRYVSSQAETQSYSFRIVTIGHPGWRSKAQRMLQPVPVQTQGAEAWLLAKEDAATLATDLAKRIDYRSHGSPRVMVHNGQTATVTIGSTRTYLHGMVGSNQAPGFLNNKAKFQEGFSLELNPLLSLDQQTVDAMVKCNIDQLERLVPVRLESPPSLQQPGRLYTVEVPQTSSCRFHERFRWPVDKVLLISLGMVARPVPTLQSPLQFPLTKAAAPRGDVLIFLDSKGSSTSTGRTSPTVATRPERFRGRY